MLTAIMRDRQAIGGGFSRCIGWLSRHRKKLLSTTILAMMGMAVIYLDGGTRGFVITVGSLLLGTDYEVLNIFGLKGVYDRIEPTPSGIELVYEFWKYRRIDEDITPVEIKLWNDNDGRIVLDDPKGLINVGTELFVCVKDHADGETESHEYDLRLGIAEVTRIEPSDDSKTVFLSVTDSGWFDESDFEDEEQRRIAQRCQERMKDGDLDDDPFVKIMRSEELRSLDVRQWESLFEEIESR